MDNEDIWTDAGFVADEDGAKHHRAHAYQCLVSDPWTEFFSHPQSMIADFGGMTPSLV